MRHGPRSALIGLTAGLDKTGPSCARFLVSHRFEMRINRSDVAMRNDRPIATKMVFNPVNLRFAIGRWRVIGVMIKTFADYNEPAWPVADLCAARRVDPRGGYGSTRWVDHAQFNWDPNPKHSKVGMCRMLVK